MVPLDGTINFVHGLPVFCVSMALWSSGRPEVAVVHAPRLGETFHAVRGGGAFVEAEGRAQERLAVSRTSALGDAILATGFTHFDSINKPEWGFGTFQDVVTTTQVEQMISSGSGVRCPSDGRKPKRVAILLCVGSRDRQIGREWCSKICCTVSANMAMEIREELPDCHVYIYYMDIRTFGLYEGRYYWRSQEEFKVKYIKARIAEVTGDGKQVIVKGEETTADKRMCRPPGSQRYSLVA